MTRIISGNAKGRALKVPDRDTRPTSDRVKESLFSALEHRYGGFTGLNVLDLFAGSGALGLEAASRGARDVLLVERAPTACVVIGENIKSSRLTQVRLAAMDVTQWVQSAAAKSSQGWDVVFVDPPYDLPEVDIVNVLAALISQSALAPECEVLVERRKSRGGPPMFAWPEGLEQVDLRTYGDTVVFHAVCYGQLPDDESVAE